MAPITGSDKFSSMLETAAETAELQELLDRTYERASPQYRLIVTPARRLSAAQVVRLLRGKRFIAFATTTGDGAPRAMPLDALFLHGRFHWTTDAAAARIANLQRDPRCSATWFEGDELMVTVHGRAQLIEVGHPDYEELESTWERESGSRPSSWGPHVYHGRVEPTHMYAFAQHPENFLDS